MENNFGKKKSFAKNNSKSKKFVENKLGDKKGSKNYQNEYKTKNTSGSKTSYKKFDKTEKSDLEDRKIRFEKQNFDDVDKKGSFKKNDKKFFGEKNEKSSSEDKRKGLRKKESNFKTKEAPNYNFSNFEKNKEKVSKNTDTRLNKYIANAGICSRREADELIANGLIKVNGKVVKEMGYQVKPQDKVSYQGKVLHKEKLVYVLLNKPKNCITTTDDPEERKTVMEIVKDACQERIYPVGRLDRNTTSLLLLTNDGEVAKKLSHPSSNIKKVYQVTLDKPITEEDFLAIEKGIELEDGFIKPDAFAALSPNTLGIELHSGRNRIVRRIFEHFGYQVEKLDRTMYAGLTKKDLPRGKWRFLTQKEVVMIKYLLK